MSRADQYMSLAEEVRAKAASEESPVLKADWEILAETYVRLAEQSGDGGSAPAYDPIADMLERSSRRK